jgi:hypothetical protein
MALLWLLGFLWKRCSAHVSVFQMGVAKSGEFTLSITPMVAQEAQLASDSDADGSSRPSSL